MLRTKVVGINHNLVPTFLGRDAQPRLSRPPVVPDERLLEDTGSSLRLQGPDRGTDDQRA